MNKNIMISIGVILSLLLIFYFGYISGKRIEIQTDTKTEIKHIEKKIELSEKIVDSIKATVEKQTEIVTEYETILKEIESEYKDVEKPKDSVCLEDYYKYKKSNDNLKLQIVYKDSIIQTKDTIIKGLKHIIREKDMIILEKDKHIEVLSKPKKSKAKPFGIGLQVGATYNGGELKEYIGGGISYNFIRF